MVEIVLLKNIRRSVQGITTTEGIWRELLLDNIRINFLNKTSNSLKLTHNFKLCFSHVARNKTDLFEVINSGLRNSLLTANIIVLSPNFYILQTMKIFKRCYPVDKISSMIQIDGVLSEWKHTETTNPSSNNVRTCFIPLLRRVFSCLGLKNIFNNKSGSEIERRWSLYHFNANEDNISKSNMGGNIVRRFTENNLMAQWSTNTHHKNTDEDTKALDVVCNTNSPFISSTAVLEDKLDKSAENSLPDNSHVVVASIENINRFDTYDNDKMEAAFCDINAEDIEYETVTTEMPRICKEEHYFENSTLTPTETWKINVLIPCFNENFSLYSALPRIHHKNTVTSTSGCTVSIEDCSSSGSSSFKIYSLNEPRTTAVRANMCGRNGVKKTVQTKDPGIISLVQRNQCTADQPSNINTNAATSANNRTCDQEEFLEKLHECTLTSLSEVETNDVQKSVEFIVRRLLYRIGEEDSRFYVREVVTNGSFYDGTKICHPDEFDYLAVIEELSISGVNVSRHRNHNEGFAHVQLDGSLSLEWNDLCTNGIVCCVKQDGLSSFRDQFRILFNDILRKEIFDKMNVIVHKLSGVLLVTGLNVSIHGPECIVTAKWHSKTTMTSFPITIDICPAIQADCVSAIVSARESLFHSAYKSMLQNERYFLIPSDSRSCSFCFKLAFADSDRSLVTGLNDTHRKCFRILKLLFREATYADYSMHSVLNSFVVKMAVLRHADSCVTPSMKSCIIEVLTNLRQIISLKEPYLPNVHLQTRNIWKNLDVGKDKDKRVVTAVVKLLDKFIDLITDMTQAGEFHKDRFLKYVQAFVRSC